MAENIWWCISCLNYMNKSSYTRESKRIEEDVTYSAKAHFNNAAFWSGIQYWLGIPATIASTIAGSSALAKFQYHDYVASMLAISAAILTGIMTFLNPKERAAQHLQAGNKYNSIKNNARLFHEVELSKLSEEKAAETLKRLSNERNELNEKSLQISKRAFNKARKGIEEGEATYHIDKEVSKDEN